MCRTEEKYVDILVGKSGSDHLEYVGDGKIIPKQLLKK